MDKRKNIENLNFWVELDLYFPFCYLKMHSKHERYIQNMPVTYTHMPITANPPVITSVYNVHSTCHKAEIERKYERSINRNLLTNDAMKETEFQPLLKQ